MKVRKFTVKNTVLCTIAAFTAIMLLVSLAFHIIRIDASGFEEIVKVNANGFDMLSFSFTALLYEGLDEFLLQQVIDAYEIVFGVLSVMILLYSIFTLVYAIMAIFFGERKRNEKVLFIIILAALILSVGYSVVSIVFAVITNNEIPSDSLVSFKTSAFVGLIIQALCFAAYVIVEMTLKSEEDEETGQSEQSKGAYAKTEMREKRTVCTQETLSEITDSLKQLAGVVRQYKKLYDDGVISVMDFSEKKARVLNSCRTRLGKAMATFPTGSLKDYVRAEIAISDILVECKNLLTEEAFTDGEYVEWKAYFFTLIS